MTDTAQNNKRIAKNTLLLYIRMLLLMAINLYTSRIILKALGVEDFGIYNVVGGVVSMFSIICSSLSTAISRFLTFELGKGDKEKLKNIFSASVTIQLLLSIIIVVLVELIGVWFLNTKMSIPTQRIFAANWVLQFSLLTFVINLISIPYNAAIIAHEKMSAFAYVSIIEGIGKLCIAFLIMISPFDKLIFYAILMCTLAIIVRLIYSYYCKRHFEECIYHFIWDKITLNKIFGFAGWNFIGCCSAILRDQGVNILLNIFYGPIVNTARGIAFQVNSAINGFVTNFMTALNPQITKNYASGDYNYMFTLIYKGARFSFYLLLLLSLPVLWNTNYILDLWLGKVPNYTVSFVRLTIIFAMCESVSIPLITAMMATGKIRNYQIVVGGLQMLNFPLSYIALHYGYSPEIAFIIMIVISVMCLIARLIMLRKMINLIINDYIRKVILNVIIVSLITNILPFLISFKMYNTFSFFCYMTLTCIISSLGAIIFIGCNKSERKLLYESIIKIKNKYFHDKNRQ